MSSDSYALQERRKDENQLCTSCPGFWECELEIIVVEGWSLQMPLPLVPNYKYFPIGRLKSQSVVDNEFIQLCTYVYNPKSTECNAESYEFDGIAIKEGSSHISHILAPNSSS